MIVIIINNTILKGKFEEGDNYAYDYLIDNTETDAQTISLLGLKRLQKLVPKDDEDYLSIRRSVLLSMGIRLEEL